MSTAPTPLRAFRVRVHFVTASGAKFEHEESTSSSNAIDALGKLQRVPEFTDDDPILHVVLSIQPAEQEAEAA